MASASTLTTFDAFLKELYSGTSPQDAAMQDHPFLGMIPKQGDFEGDVMPVPILHGHPQGRSHTFSASQATASSSQSKKFLLTRTRDYITITIDSELIRASRSNIGSFAEAKKVEVDGAIEELGNSAAHGLYSTGVAVRGERGSISTNAVTLANKTDARFFDNGMTIGAVSDATGSGTIRVGETTVAAMDRQAGIVHLTSAAAIAAFADGDFLFQSGDVTAVSQTQSITGLQGWIPAVAPTLGGGDSHFNVDRAVDVDRLAGLRINEPTAPIYESLLKAGELINVNKGKASHAFIHSTKYSELILDLAGKLEFVREPGRNSDGVADVFFDGVRVHSSAGSFMVFPDPDCPIDRGYVLTMNTWKLRHLDGFPHIVDDDGLTSLRQSADDGLEFRIRQWGNGVCAAPGRNCVVLLSA